MANLLLATVNLEPRVQNPVLRVEEFYRHAKKELIDNLAPDQYSMMKERYFCYHIYSAIRQVVSFPKHTKNQHLTNKTDRIFFITL